MSDQTPHTVAFIGAGPASLYGAAKVAKAGHNVVILNRDIKPGGLAEYGIYLNKYKMKNGLRRMFSKILADDNVHYYGNVTVGEQADLTLEDVSGLGFGATVVAVGAQGTKWLGLDGERSRGVYHAKDLVYHYNSLPPFSEQDFAIGQDVVVVGFGNVALDIVRWLVCEKKVNSVTMVARRGPKERASTPKELKAISGAINTEEIDAEFARIRDNLVELGQDVQVVRDDLLKFKLKGVPLEAESSTSVKMRFLRSPSSVKTDEDGNVVALVCDKTLMTPPRSEGGRPGVKMTGEVEELACDTIVFAIGDSIEPSIGLPVDAEWGSLFATVPTPWEGNPEAPRYMVWDPATEEPRWGTFVVGWARKASDGLVGKARADAETGVEEILGYLNGQMDRAPGEVKAAGDVIGELEALLTERGVDFVDLDGVARIEAREKELATAQELPECKFRSNEEMLALGGRASR